MKVLTVLGTRPEGIKLAPVIRAIEADDELESAVCATAQHREMLDEVLDLFDIAPDHDLDLMEEDQTLTGTTASALRGIAGVLEQEAPDAVVVQGDTTSTFCGALAAYYQGIPVAHVEAGLRTGDLSEPFPEEGNRRLTDQISRWLFPPTDEARGNLLQEGFPEASITVTGNTVIDALNLMRRRLDQGVASGRIEDFRNRHGLSDERIVLVTAHRRESFGEPLTRVCRALEHLADRDDVAVVYPAHPNPNVQTAVDRELSGSGVHVTPHLDYATFVWLLTEAEIVLTDSGGIQEEAASLGTPVLVLREKTERPEAIKAGVAELVGTDPKRILDRAEALLDDPDRHAQVAEPTDAFGDGQAAERIVEALKG